MSAGENRNAYLDQVVAQQGQLEQDLRSKRASPASAPQGAVAKRERVLAAQQARTDQAPAAMDNAPATATVTPALGPSLGTAPPGTCTWMSWVSK